MAAAAPYPDEAAANKHAEAMARALSLITGSPESHAVVVQRPEGWYAHGYSGITLKSAVIITLGYYPRSLSLHAWRLDTL